MKKLLVAAVIAGSFISFEAQAQERAGSAAPGALVLGPVGAVAGALIGYAWGDGQSAPRSRVRRTARSGPVTEQPAAARVTPPPVSEIPENPPLVIKAPDTVASTRTAPPVQGFE